MHAGGRLHDVAQVRIARGSARSTYLDKRTASMERLRRLCGSCLSSALFRCKARTSPRDSVKHVTFEAQLIP